PIIHDDDLFAGPRLRESRMNGLSDRFFGVIRGDEDGNQTVHNSGPTPAFFTFRSTTLSHETTPQGTELKHSRLRSKLFLNHFRNPKTSAITARGKPIRGGRPRPIARRARLS